jgi:DNA-directed RNA polymerase subunit RPC12/RpoP
MGTLVCPRCGSRDVVNINLTLERSGRVSFYSCHRCEKRWWHRDGEDVPLGGVLDLARRVPAPSTLLPAPPPVER